MAPAKDRGAEDFEFIMTCLKHTNVLPKPDFTQVAAEMGAKSANTCYHRHWRIMNEWGLTGVRSKTAGKALKGAAAVATKTTPTTSSGEDGSKKRKRAPAKKSAKQAAAQARNDKEDQGEVESPSKRINGDVNGDGTDAELAVEEGD